MTIDRSPMWIGLADLLLCVLSIVIVAVAPTKAKVETIDLKAEYIIKISWSVDVDADVDNWLKTPRGTVFYKDEHRQVGCVTLDTDNHGFQDSRFTMLDGSTKKLAESAEVISIRCSEPGHYDHAVHLYAFSGASSPKKDLGIKVHIEFTALNPTNRILCSKDVTLDYVEQTTNDFSFDIGRDGQVSMSAPALTWITDSYYRPAGHE